MTMPNYQYPGAPMYPQQAPMQQMPMQQMYPQGQQMPQGASMQGSPMVYMPDAGQVAAAYAKAAEEALRQSQGGNKGRYFKMPGPAGETKWGPGVPVGFERGLRMWILWSYKPGELHFRTVVTHFWKSQTHPKGFSVVCPGSGCKVCALRSSVSQYPATLEKRIMDTTRSRTKILYNVAVLDDYACHMVEGRLMSWILETGAQLHAKIGEIVGMHKIGGLVDPDQGRPLLIKKKKTGPQDMDVEWSALAYDPSPMPREFRGIQLQDLGAAVVVSTEAEQLNAVQEILTGVGTGVGAGASYQAAPVAPYGNPYPQQMPPPPMSYMPPPMQQTPQAPQMQQYGQQPMPGMMQQAPQGAYAIAPPAPPPLAPPPVQVSAAQTGYQPMPSGASMPPMLPQMAPAAVTQPIKLSVPMQAGISLPGGRERCFGKFVEGDLYCRDCADWIKQQCLPLSPKGPVTNTPGAELIKLQNALVGNK